MAAYGPKPRVSSIIDNWGPYYIARTQAVMDGTWASTSTWDGIGAGMVGIGEITSAVPAGVKASAEALRDSLADGSYHAFTGPLNKQDGSVWLKAGETAADYGDESLVSMGFYLEGLEGEVPN
jgi:simple sugar transport system substrate-binding protein